MTTREPGEMSMKSHIQGRFCSQIISNHARDAVFYSNWLAWSRLRQKSDHFLPDSVPPNQLLFINFHFLLANRHILSKIKPSLSRVESSASV